MTACSTARGSSKERSARAFLAVVLGLAVVLVAGWPGRVSLRCLATGERDLEHCCCRDDGTCPAGEACHELDRDLASQPCGCCLVTLDDQGIQLAASSGSFRTASSHAEKAFVCAPPVVHGIEHPVLDDRVLVGRAARPRAGPLIFLHQRVMRC